MPNHQSSSESGSIEHEKDSNSSLQRFGMNIRLYFVPMVLTWLYFTLAKIFLFKANVFVISERLILYYWVNYDLSNSHHVVKQQKHLY